MKASAFLLTVDLDYDMRNFPIAVFPAYPTDQQVAQALQDYAEGQVIDEDDNVEDYMDSETIGSASVTEITSYMKAGE